MGLAGARLKKIRLEKGLSLEEVHKKTKIHMNILSAIEEDSLINVSAIYMKGFLKIYCNFLGVDPKGYIPDYKETKTEVGLRKIEGEQIGIDKTKIKASFIKNASSKIKAFRPSKEVVKIILIILSAIIAVMILFSLVKIVSASVSGFFAQRKAAALMKHKEPPKKIVKTQKPKVEAKPVVKEQGSVATKETKVATVSGIKLGILVRENCWISLKVDGKLLLQRVLEKGRMETWQAKEKIELSVGNAGVVELDVNGQHFTNLGRKGQSRKNIIITKDGLR